MQISMYMVRAVVAAVERGGVRREHLLSRCGLAPEELTKQDSWLAVADFKRVVDAAIEVTDDAALGLHLGEQASSVMFQLLAHLVEHATSLGEALHMIVQYTELIARDFTPRIVRAGDNEDWVALRFSWLCGDEPIVRTMAELAMAGLMRLLQQFVGEDARAAHVCFAYGEPACAAEYRRMFGGRECFAQPFTELQLPRAWLERSQLHANPELHRTLQAQAERQIGLQREPQFSARILQQLATSDPRSLPTLHEVAQALRVSERTIARRLKNERTTFAELIVNHRRSAAERLLELQTLPIPEVAEAMGFADAPAFHKAFKRWTGMTPMQYAASRKVR